MRYLATVLLVCGFATNAFASDPQKLVERINREGLVNVIRKPETLRDRELQYLELIASLYDKATQDEVTAAMKLRGMEPGPIENSPFQILPGGGSHSILSEQARDRRSNEYQIYFSNLSGELVDEVAVFYRSVYNEPGMQTTKGLQNEATFRFLVGNCTNMRDYAIGVWVGATQVSKIPANGTLTPSMAAKIGSSTTRCIDHWHVEGMFVPAPGSKP